MPKRVAERPAPKAARDGAAEFERLLEARPAVPAPAKRVRSGVVVGTLVAFRDHGATPFVTYPDQPGGRPVAARTILDLLPAHVGRPVVLMFEDDDPARPIVLGTVRTSDTGPLQHVNDGVELEADGQRLVVTADRGLVLRCGKASITLTPDGKVAVRGTQIVTHASGLNRIRGGSVQLN